MVGGDPIRNWHQIAVEMLMTEAELALQSITLLFAGDNPEGIARVVRSTRQTYDSILAKRQELSLSDQDAALLSDKVKRLRSRLKLMGETV